MLIKYYYGNILDAYSSFSLVLLSCIKMSQVNRSGIIALDRQ